MFTFIKHKAAVNPPTLNVDESLLNQNENEESGNNEELSIQNDHMNSNDDCEAADVNLNHAADANKPQGKSQVDNNKIRSRFLEALKKRK